MVPAGWRIALSVRGKDYEYGGRLLVQKYEIQGMAHAWPGGDDSYLFADPSGPDVTTLMWGFFARHAR